MEWGFETLRGHQMQFTDEEIKVIRQLIDDRGFEYGLKSNLNQVWVLANKLGMTEYCKRYKDFLD